MKTIITLILTSFFAPASCFAQTQAEMNHQAYLDYKKADAEMNKTYYDVLKVTTVASEKKLL